MSTMIANGVKVETEYADVFVKALRQQKKAMNLVLSAKGEENRLKFYNAYREVDDTVRQIGRLIFGQDWDSPERKHEDTSWRNLHSSNVKLLKTIAPLKKTS